MGWRSRLTCVAQAKAGPDGTVQLPRVFPKLGKGKDALKMFIVIDSEIEMNPCSLFENGPSALFSHLTTPYEDLGRGHSVPVDTPCPSVLCALRGTFFKNLQESVLTLLREL